MARSLFVNRLSLYTTPQRLKTIFSPFGKVTEAFLIKDPETKRPRGFGFVSFESETEARAAIKSLDGRIVDGNLIFVDFAKNSSCEEASSKQ